MTSVGVTGHRSLKDPDSVLQGIDAALRQIREEYPAPFVLYSSLAEGADRLVAWRALDLLGAGLLAVLPMEQAEYKNDFAEEKSVTEFLDLLALADQVVELAPAPSREAAYEAAGRYILEHVNLLVAVWDGRPPRGQGGTSQIVADAHKRRIPVVWVRVAR
jgi:hypothetical protein